MNLGIWPTPGSRRREAALTEQKMVLAAEVEKAMQGLPQKPVKATMAQLRQFSQIMIEKLTTGDIATRKATLQSITDQVVVDDHEIRIMGRTQLLREGAVHGPREDRENRGAHFHVAWRRERDSNPRTVTRLRFSRPVQ